MILKMPNETFLRSPDILIVCMLVNISTFLLTEIDGCGTAIMYSSLKAKVALIGVFPGYPTLSMMVLKSKEQGARMT